MINNPQTVLASKPLTSVTFTLMEQSTNTKLVCGFREPRYGYRIGAKEIKGFIIEGYTECKKLANSCQQSVVDASACKSVLHSFGICLEQLPCSPIFQRGWRYFKNIEYGDRTCREETRGKMVNQARLHKLSCEVSEFDTARLFLWGYIKDEVYSEPM